VAVGSQQHLALGPCHQRHILGRVGCRQARPDRSDVARGSCLPSASSRHIDMSIAGARRPPSQLRTSTAVLLVLTSSPPSPTNSTANAGAGDACLRRKGMAG
jgi:hypothetical protein